MKNILATLAITASLLLAGCGSSSNEVPVFSKESQFDASIVSNGERAFNGYQLTRKTVTQSPDSDHPRVLEYIYSTTPSMIVETLKSPFPYGSDEHIATYELSEGYIWARETAGPGFKTNGERYNYTYDTNGHMLGVYAGEVQTTRWEYDDQARVTAIRSSIPENFTELTYSTETGNLQAVVFEQSVLLSSGANQIVLTKSAIQTFNSAGQMISFENWSGDTPGDGSLTARGSREFDNNGNLVREVRYKANSSGEVKLAESVTYEYEALQGAWLMNLALWNRYP